jgi:hypothetical protein
MSEDSHKGLKKRRENLKDKKPLYECANCKCKRYSPCKCQKAVA